MQVKNELFFTFFRFYVGSIRGLLIEAPLSFRCPYRKRSPTQRDIE